jgi:hypothetical protein
MCLQGPSGAGKTYSALLIAYGLCNSWEKVAVIDTENHSSELYAHLGSYNVVHLNAPHSPERYREALEVCERAGMEVIIIDSLTHEWEFLLDYHSSLVGNSFTNWGKITPRHNEFVQRLLQSPAHIIGTVRTKQDYVLNEKNGKLVPEKVGLKSVQRDGLEYEMTVVFDLDMKNNAVASKDRTGLFFGKPEFKISSVTGQRIQLWCNSGEPITALDVSKRIEDVVTLQQLLALYQSFPQYQQTLKEDFEQKKRQLLINQETQKALAHKNINQNGTGN